MPRKTSSKHTQKNAILIAIAQVIYFTVLALWFTRPLAGKLRTHIAGGLGDNLYFIWQIGWFKQAIFDLGQLPFHSHLLNFPYGYNLAVTEIAPLQLIFALPFALQGELVLGFNVSMLLTFILAGLTMSYWVHHLSGSRLAGLASGTAYAFLPYHMAHFLSGHLNISAIQWFPLFFWGFTAILTEKKYSLRNVLLLAAGLSGIALSSQYYLYMTLIVSGMMLLVYFIFMQRDQFLNWNLWKQFILAGLFAIPALVVGIVPYYLVHDGSGSGRALADVMTFSASITDFILPFTRQMIAGKWVWKHFPRDLWNEATLYLGIPLLVLACVGYCQRKQLDKRTLFNIFLTGFIISLILAMGTNLTWMEQPVVLPEDAWLTNIFRNESHLVLLPGYWFFKYVPFYSVMRAWMRMGIFAMLFNCAAAGMGIAWLVTKVGKKYKTILSVLFLLLILVDFSVTPNALSEVKPREVDLWLADQPYGGQVQLPLKQSYEEFALYATLTNQKPLIGQIRTFTTDRQLTLAPLLKDFPDATSVKALRDEGVTYIVLDEDDYPVDEAFIEQCEALGLSYRISLDGQTVFEFE